MDIQSFLPSLSDDEYEALKADIAANGVLVPVVVDQHGAIVDGHHRVRACKELGITDYPVAVRIYASEEQRTEDMLKLNLQRRHVDRAQLKELARHLYFVRGWTQERIARVIGIPRRTISDWTDSNPPVNTDNGDFAIVSKTDIVSDSLPQNREPTPTVYCKNTRQASLSQTLLASMDDESKKSLPSMMDVDDLKKEARKAHLARTHDAPDVASPPGFDLFNEDFRVGMERIPDESVQLIFTDPPYGKEYIPLYEDLARLAARKLEDGGSLLCYVGQTKLAEVIPLFSRYLRYFWTCCCLHDHGKKQLMTAHGIAVAWKPILWFVKGWRAEPTVVVQDVVSGKPDKSLHPWQQSVDNARYFIHWLTTNDGTVVDPFAGTGTTLVAALQEGRHGIGFEVDPITYAKALARLNEDARRYER